MSQSQLLKMTTRKFRFDMSHQPQLDFVKSVKDKFPKYFKEAKVLEIGSLNINGTVRIFFEDCRYLGVDLAEGKDVDLVSKGHELKFSNNSFDTVISCECFEHDKHWILTFQRMYEMCNGLIVFTCATEGRPEHGTSRTNKADSPFTDDYYCNLTEKDFRAVFDIDDMFKEYGFSVYRNTCDLYFWGKK